MWVSILLYPGGGSNVDVGTDRESKVRQFLADSPRVVASALPFIVGGGILGVWLGSVLGSPANGFRVGVILGGAVAFVRLQRKRKKPS